MQRLNCAVPENIHNHPKKVIGNSEGRGGEGGGLKCQFFQKYEAKLEFPESGSPGKRCGGGGGGKPKKIFQSQPFKAYYHTHLI